MQNYEVKIHKELRKDHSVNSPWLEVERATRHNMRLGSARLYQALVAKHPRIVRHLQKLNNVKVEEF